MAKEGDVGSEIDEFQKLDILYNSNLIVRKGWDYRNTKYSSKKATPNFKCFRNVTFIFFYLFLLFGLLTYISSSYFMFGFYCLLCFMNYQTWPKGFVYLPQVGQWNMMNKVMIIFS